MVYFWQLSGPDSHFSRNWRAAPGEPVGNAKIALHIFRSMSRKLEDGGQVVDLILGIETSGASHILVPEAAEKSLRELSWRNKNPYPASRFASLSPIHVGRDILQTLLEDRQSVSGSTAASKNKGDNSKANYQFWDSPPRPARAAFEHGRCFWRIMHRELHPQVYGLPDAPWSGGLDIISLAMNFWSGDNTTFLDAGVTCMHLPSDSGSHQEEGYTWYFKSKIREVLCNSQSMRVDTPVTWSTTEVDADDKAHVGMEIQSILDKHSNSNGPLPAPLILLVHDSAAVKDSLDSLGIQTSTWKHDLKDLLGYPALGLAQHESDPRQSYDWSHSSPHARASTGLSMSNTISPDPVQLYAPVYVVDTLAMFKTVTWSGNTGTTRPVDVFNKITCSYEIDGLCGGSDSNYILQSWRTMVTGASLDEQTVFYMSPSMNSATQHGVASGSTSETAEDAQLYQVEEAYDLFNDGSDSEDDY